MLGSSFSRKDYFPMRLHTHTTHSPAAGFGGAVVVVVAAVVAVVITQSYIQYLAYSIARIMISALRMQAVREGQ